MIKANTTLFIIDIHTNQGLKECCSPSVRSSGDSMCPIINSGDIIAMKEVKDWQSFLLMNEAYGIVTSNEQRMVKVIRPGSDTDHFILHSYNSEYPDQEIDKNMVLRIYKVIGAISIRSI